MALDTLEVFGTEYTNVAGFKATDDNGQTKTYVRPQGTKSITENGTGIDVTGFASVNVAVQSGVDPSNLEIAVNPSSAVGTAIVGTAETEAPNYTPGGDVVMDYEIVNKKLYIKGFRFLGSGTKLILQEVE